MPFYPVKTRIVCTVYGTTFGESVDVQVMYFLYPWFGLENDLSELPFTTSTHYFSELEIQNGVPENGTRKYMIIYYYQKNSERAIG